MKKWGVCIYNIDNGRGYRLADILNKIEQDGNIIFSINNSIKCKGEIFTIIYYKEVENEIK